jgi:selenide,water dikinase
MVALGEVRPDKVITNSGARPGDALVLTKPIGTGVLSTALKRDLIAERDMATAVRSMTTLNAGAMRAMRDVEDAVHAATDITGFGLLGHLRNVLAASQAGARLFVERVPVFPGVRELVERGAIAGGSRRNAEAAAQFTRFASSVSETDRMLLSDAQTSGGLLIAVDARRADALVARLNEYQTPAAAVIGEIVKGEATVDVTSR